MIPLYNDTEFKISKSKTKLPCKCKNCLHTFFLTKERIQSVLNPKSKHTGDFCSINCKNCFSRQQVICSTCSKLFFKKKSEFNNKNNFCSIKCSRVSMTRKKMVNCLNCLKSFEKSQAEIKKSANHFCSKSCAVTYNNKHKSTGNRRSKLEIYLEEQLTLLYPNTEFHFNRKDAIGSELDIYIPNLKLAFELNGIFHYEPIYGSDKLNQIQNNDISKSKACIDNQIDLCIIDSSGLKYFKPSNAQKYLDIIVNIINQRTSLLTS